jgi:hypothetical protein
MHVGAWTAGFLPEGRELEQKRAWNIGGARTVLYNTYWLPIHFVLSSQEAFMSGRMHFLWAFAAFIAVIQPAGVQALSDDIRGIVVQGPQRPFSDTMAAMIARDAQWRAEIEAGLRPAPPPMIAIGSHSRNPRPVSDGESAFSIFLPAVFLDPEPDQGQIRDYRVLAPQEIGASFIGITMQNQSAGGTFWIPPDTCGAIGPNHFVEILNGSVAVFTRTGTRLSHVTLTSFLTMNYGGTTYPRSYAFDPRIVYDRRSARWFATALEYNSGSANHAILAVSRTSNPSGTWDKYLIQIGRTGNFTDYPTLGVDGNGVYIPVTFFAGTSTKKIITATRKASLIASSPYLDTVYSSPDTQEFYATPYAAFSLDATPSDGPAWFVGSNPSVYRDMRISSLTWPTSGAPTFSAVTNLSLPTFAQPPTAPAKGSTTDIDAGDMRMHSAMVRGGHLWTCRTVGVNSGGGSPGADRTAIEWVELDVSGSSPSIVQTGRLFDSAASNPVFFYYPSVAVNGLGQMALSFSDSNGNRWVSAETTGRLAGDPPGTLQSILGIVSGQNSYTRVASGFNRWGDYSTTSVDPNDDLSIWTVQEYATATKDSWGTWIAQLMAPAPTLNNPGGSAPAGTSGVNLALTGTGIFDPGPDFPNRLSIQLAGGTVNGIGNYVVTYNSPTSASVTFDIAANATPGTRDIVLTNPDGRQATVVAGFTVTANNGTTLTVAPASGRIGESVTLSATLVRTSDSSPLAGETVSFTVDGAAAGDAVTNASGVAEIAYYVEESLGTGDFIISASFAGNPPLEPSVGTGTLTVEKAPTTTLAVSVAGRIGMTVNLSATLTRDTDGAPLPGRTLTFAIASVTVGGAETDPSGTANLPYQIPESLGVGSHTIEASFGGDAGHLASNGSASLQVLQGETTLTAADVDGQLGAAVTLTAALTCTDSGGPVVGRTVSFTVAGTVVGDAATNASGVASIGYVIPVAGGVRTDTITVVFAGDSLYLSSTDTASLNVAKADTSLSVGNATGGFGDTVALSATLVRSTDLTPLSGRTIAFSVEGTGVGDAATDGAGSASVNYTIPEALGAGSKTITAAFAGDADHNASSGTGTLDVIPWPTTLTVADASGTVSLTTTLSAILLRADTSAPIPGEPITFTVAGTAAGGATTDATGTASADYTIPDTIGSGSLELIAGFAGDSHFAAASDTGTLTVTRAATSQWTIDRTGTITELVILRQFDLARTTDGALLSGRTIAFKIDGTTVGTGTTNAGGDSTLDWIVTDGPESRTIATEFAGDAAYTGSSAMATLTAQTHATKMYGVDREGPITAYRIFKAWLYRMDSTPVRSKPILFRVDGTAVGTDTTRTTGLAQVGYTIPDGSGAGTRAIKAEWAGDGGYLPSSCTNTLTVLRATPYIWVMPRSVPQGGVARLYAYFRRLADYQKQEAKQVTFRIDGTFIADVLTGTGADAGIARYDYTTVQPTGTHTIRCEFSGDPWLNAGYGEASLTIY